MLAILVAGFALTSTPMPSVPSVSLATAEEMRYSNGAEVCKNRGLELAKTDDAQPRKLNELPNADLIKTVFRIGADGCTQPLIIRYDVGSAPSRRDMISCRSSSRIIVHSGLL